MLARFGFEEGEVENNWQNGQVYSMGVKSVEQNIFREFRGMSTPSILQMIPPLPLDQGLSLLKEKNLRNFFHDFKMYENFSEKNRITRIVLRKN